MGYRFQFITLAGFHALNAGMFELAGGYAAEGMTAYVRLQEREFELEEDGYTATRHQREVGAGYFDLVAQAVVGRRELDPRAQGLDRRGAVPAGARLGVAPLSSSEKRPHPHPGRGCGPLPRRPPAFPKGG